MGINVRVKSGCALSVDSHHPRVRHLILGNAFLQIRFSKLATWEKGAMLLLTMTCFPAQASFPVSTVTSESTAPTRTAVSCQEQRVEAWVLETSPWGMFPPKGTSCFSFPSAQGLGSPRREGCPKVANRIVSFHVFFYIFFSPPRFCI